MTSGPERRTARFELDLVTDEDPIQGHLHDPTGHTTPFRGWLELIQLLDRAATPAPQPDRPPPEPGT